MAAPPPKGKGGGGLALVLGAGPKGGADDGEESEKVSAARDIIDAVKSGDADMLNMALEHHYELCRGEEESSEGEGGEGEDNAATRY